MRYLDLLNMQYKWHFKVFLMFGLFLLIVSFVLTRDIHDVYNTYGYVENNNIVFNLDLDHGIVLDNGDYVKINGHKHDFKVLEIGDIKVDQNNMINYQEVLLTGGKKYRDNQVIKLAIYYNKETVWKKLKEIIWR